MYIFLRARRTFRLNSDSQRSSCPSELESPRPEVPALTSQDHGDSSQISKNRQNKKKTDMAPIDGKTFHQSTFDGRVYTGILHKAKYGEHIYAGILLAAAFAKTSIYTSIPAKGFSCSVPATSSLNDHSYQDYIKCFEVN